MLKRRGDSGSQCFTPLVMGIFDVSPFASVKFVLASVYRSTTVSVKWLFTQNLFSPSPYRTLLLGLGIPRSVSSCYSSHVSSGAVAEIRSQSSPGLQ